jgi:hypothetical protein
VRTTAGRVWTVQHLMEAMAPSAAEAPAMVEAALATIASPQTIDGFTFDPRPGMRSLILDRWPRTADGALDLSRAPLTLQAIVNRLDLRNLDTERFAGRGARPGHVNGSPINAVRTNEIDFGTNALWQLREFELSAATGRLAPSTVKLTPDLSFNGSGAVASFINANEASIIAETHAVPAQLGGAPFLTGAVFNDWMTAWQAPGINNRRRAFTSRSTPATAATPSRRT